MAKNYQKCLEYLDFDSSDFYFTEDQKREIIEKFDMYFVLTSTEYQMEQISKALLRLDSDENIWRILGIRLRHKSKPSNPQHINRLLKMPKDFDITIIFKDSLKYQLEDLNEVCRKSKYNWFPRILPDNIYCSDYNDYMYLSEEVKKNRKLSYKPASAEYVEAQRRRNNDAIHRMRSHFIEAEKDTYVPISEKELDPNIIRKEQEKQRRDELRKYNKAFNNRRKAIINTVIDNKKIDNKIVERMSSKYISDESVSYIIEMIDNSHMTSSIIYTLLTPNLNTNILIRLTNIICSRDFDMTKPIDTINKFIGYCIKYSIEDIKFDNQSDINKLVAIYEACNNTEYINYLIKNIDNVSVKMINIMKQMYVNCSMHPSIIIEVFNICNIIKSTCTDKNKILYNAIIAADNGVSIKDIEYGVKHCSDNGTKMWLLMRMAEHGLPLDNPDIDHVVFDMPIERMIRVMNKDEYPVEMMLEMIEGLVNHYGIRHRYYTMSEISSYFDVYVRKINEDLMAYTNKYNMNYINFTINHRYAHTIHYIKADDKFNDRICDSKTSGRFFIGTFRDMNDGLSGHVLNHHITPDEIGIK